MKQYWLFMVNCICNILFCAADSAFSNGISIDAVVVMGCFVPIEWLGMQFLRMGCFAYQTYQKYEKNCMLISIGCGIITGTIVISCAVPISNLFALSEAQKHLLQGILRIYGFCMPMEAASRFMQTYVTYKCYNKLAITANVLTYFIIIGTDWLSVVMGWDLYGIIAATELSWFVYLIILAVACKIWKSEDKIDLHIIKKCVLHAKDLLISRSLSRFATIIMTRFISKIGEYNYAIYSVCIGAVSLAEECRDATVDYALVVLREAKDKFITVRKTLKQCFTPSLLLQIGFAYGALIFMHGKVGLKDCIVYLPFYMLPMLTYQLYDIIFAYFMSIHNTKVTFLRGIISCFWRIPIAMLIDYFSGGLIAYAFLFLCDYLSITIVYYILYHKDKQKFKKLQFN